MKYKIVIDSCGELPFQYQNDIRFERVPLAVFMKDGYRLSSNPFVMKYIKSALQNITL